MRRWGWVAVTGVVAVAGTVIAVAALGPVREKAPDPAAAGIAAGGSGSPPSGTSSGSTSCTPTAGQALRGWDGPTHGPSRLRLGPGMALRRTPATIAASRRGQPMVVTGRVLSSSCTPVPGAAVRVWQTNGDGDYGPGQGTEEIRCCYVQGTMTTDVNGGYEFESVRPGNYSGTPHLHVLVRAPDGRGLEIEVELADEPGAGGGPVLHLVAQGDRIRGTLNIVLG